MILLRSLGPALSGAEMKEARNCSPLIFIFRVISNVENIYPSQHSSHQTSIFLPQQSASSCSTTIHAHHQVFLGIICSEFCPAEWTTTALIPVHQVLMALKVYHRSFYLLSFASSTTAPSIFLLLCTASENSIFLSAFTELCA